MPKRRFSVIALTLVFAGCATTGDVSNDGGASSASSSSQRSLQQWNGSMPNLTPPVGTGAQLPQD